MDPQGVSDESRSRIPPGEKKNLLAMSNKIRANYMSGLKTDLVFLSPQVVAQSNGSSVLGAATSGPR